MVTISSGILRLGVKPNRFSESLHTVRAGCGAKHEFEEYTSTGCPTVFPQVCIPSLARTHSMLVSTPLSFVQVISLGATFNRSLWTQVRGMVLTVCLSGRLYMHCAHYMPAQVADAISDEARALTNQPAMIFPAG